jgi:hypothetical protein
MKKLFLFISFVIACGFAKAQNEQPADPQQKEQNIEALKVAFISRELNLTPAEAEKFWPVYNEYSQELKLTFRDNPDVLDRDEKILNIRKRYKEQFIKIVGPDRTNNLFGAEGRFHQLLIRRLRNQQNRPNRPFLRRS